MGFVGPFILLVPVCVGYLCIAAIVTVAGRRFDASSLRIGGRVVAAGTGLVFTVFVLGWVMVIASSPVPGVKPEFLWEVTEILLIAEYRFAPVLPAAGALVIHLLASHGSQ